MLTHCRWYISQSSGSYAGNGQPLVYWFIELENGLPGIWSFLNYCIVLCSCELGPTTNGLRHPPPPPASAATSVVTRHCYDTIRSLLSHRHRLRHRLRSLLPNSRTRSPLVFLLSDHPSVGLPRLKRWVERLDTCLTCKKSNYLQGTRREFTYYILYITSHACGYADLCMGREESHRNESHITTSSRFQ